MTNTRIAAISDLHGRLPAVPESDILLIAGDICRHGNADQQLHWLDTKFRRWLDAVDRPVFACAGNHDWAMYKQASAVRDLSLPWTYLQDTAAEYHGLKIWGSPWQKEFCNWAFNLCESQLAMYWEQIPDDTNILITHSPPFGIGDIVPRGTHEGSPSLTQRVEVVWPKLHVFGHIHEGRGVWERSGDRGRCVLANVTLLDGDYRKVYEPFVCDLEH